MEPEPFARILGEYVGEYGVAVVGGCCGTRPDAHRRPCATRRLRPRTEPREIEYIPSVSSGMRAVALEQDLTLLMIGERVNTLGSRKVKRLLLDDDYDGVMEVAREQMDSGAHVLDVCVAMTERADELEQMHDAAQEADDEHRAAAGDRHDRGRCAARRRWRSIPAARSSTRSRSRAGAATRSTATMPLVARYGAATVAMTIDEEGMAHTAERKLEIAQRIAQIAARRVRRAGTRR